MKKIILLTTLILLSFVAFSQTVTKSALTRGSNEAGYFQYNGVAADTLTTYLDSIQYTVELSDNRPYKFDVGATFTKRSGNDTLIIMTAYGKVNGNESAWTRIASTHSANITSTTGIWAGFSHGTAVQYRTLKIDFQIAGVKSTGVKVKNWSLKIWPQ